MKKTFVAVSVWLFILFCALWVIPQNHVHAKQVSPSQTPAVAQSASTATSANCVTQFPPLIGYTYYCFGGDGKAMVSINGAPYAAWPPAPAQSGVSQITVCNLGGSTCGSAQVGAVKLNIPTALQ